jgi:hypothetical protein
MKMYRNYDGNKSTFGDTSVRANAPNPNSFGAYAAVRSSDGALTVMAINKDLNNATPLTLNLSNFTATGSAQVWQLTSVNIISQLANTGITNGVLNQLLPAQSITLFVVPGATAVTPFSLRLGTSHPPGQLQFWLDGQAGRTYIIQSSTNLITWSGFSTNTLVSNSVSFYVTTTNTARKFYRGLLNSL